MEKARSLAWRQRPASRFSADLCKWMDAHGSLATLRHGFKCYGRTLRVAFFKAAHGLNPELEARYAANRLGLTRQLHFSERDREVAGRDAELERHSRRDGGIEKSAHRPDVRGRAQAISEQDRDPRETIFEFKRRTLGAFCRGHRGGVHDHATGGHGHAFSAVQQRSATAARAIRPTRRAATIAPPICGRKSCSATACWICSPVSSICEIEEKRTEDGRKVKKETMIFPRYHQLQAVHKLVDAARTEGPGHNYLVEHSAGSGKSNTIGWLAHRLASLHDAQEQASFRQRHRRHRPRRPRSSSFRTPSISSSTARRGAEN